MGFDRERSEEGGYATEASAAVLNWVAQQPGISSISATIPDDNYPSQRLAARLGLIRTGESRRNLPLWKCDRNFIVKTATKAGMTLLASNAKPSLPATVELQHYSIDYAVDSSGLRFVPMENDIRHWALNFVIAIFDEGGRQLSGVSSVWTNDLKPVDHKDVVRGGVRIHQEVDVPVKAVSLLLGIDDALSNHLGTIELPLPVPTPPDIPRAVKHSEPEIEPD